MAGSPLRGPRGVPGRLWLGLMIGGLTAFGPLSIDMYLPALPQISSDLHASAALTQLTITGFLVGLGTGQLVLGPLSDAFGRRRPLLAGLTIYVVATLTCARRAVDVRADPDARRSRLLRRGRCRDRARDHA